MTRGLPRLAFAALLAVLSGSGALAVEIEVNDMLEDSVRAKVAKHRAIQSASRSNNAGEPDGDEDGGAECGSIDIGNAIKGKPGAPGPKEIVVVVKGDIINANNQCKD